MLTHHRVRAALSVALGALACTAPSPLDQLIEAHTQAMGGRDAIEEIASTAVDVSITEPGFTVQGHYFADRAGRMRIDVFADSARVFTEALRDTVAWQMVANGTVTTSSTAGRAALWHGTQYPGKLFGLHEMERLGHRIELLADERMDGTTYAVVRLTYRDGYSTHLYINPQNWLIERQRDRQALHPDADSTVRWIEHRHSDFRPVDGVLRPFRSVQVDLRSGQVLQATEISRVRTNLTLPDTAFVRGTVLQGK